MAAPVITAMHKYLDDCFGDWAKSLEMLKTSFVQMSPKSGLNVASRTFKLQELEEHGDLAMAGFLATVTLPDNSQAHVSVLELWKRIGGEWKWWRQSVTPNGQPVPPAI